MMKRFLIVTALIMSVIVLTLSACSSQESATNSTSDDRRSANTGQFTSLLPFQLAAGTLRLEETDLAVTAEQAAVLLPLWKAANALNQADNVAQAELDAVYKQIQEAMTPQQMETIQSMQLDGETMANLAEELGIELPSGGTFEPSPERQATMEAARQSGQLPQGFVPGGGPDGFVPREGFTPPEGFQGLQGGNNQTAIPGARGRFENLFIQVVIDLLEKKIQE